MEETFTHLSLDIGEPEGGGGGEELRGATPLSQLLARWFDEEGVERRCEHCHHTEARVSHALSSLPRTLVLHLKRFRLLAPAAAPLAADAAAAGATPPPKAAAQLRKERARVAFPQSLCVDRLAVAAPTRPPPLARGGSCCSASTSTSAPATPAPLSHAVPVASFPPCALLLHRWVLRLHLCARHAVAVASAAPQVRACRSGFPCRVPFQIPKRPTWFGVYEACPHTFALNVDKPNLRAAAACRPPRRRRCRRARWPPHPPPPHTSPAREEVSWVARATNTKPTSYTGSNRLRTRREAAPQLVDCRMNKQTPRALGSRGGSLYPVSNAYCARI